MVNRPSVPEIITVNSEELQTLIRDLLPSQNGFGSELQASNVITPIIDLTATAEGSTLRSDLQSAIAFGSQTAFDEQNSSSVIANSPGFYRIFGATVNYTRDNDTVSSSFTMSDGLSTKTVWKAGSLQLINSVYAVDFDFIAFLSTGESISAVATADGHLSGSIRQIADSEGSFVNPSGFPL